MHRAAALAMIIPTVFKVRSVSTGSRQGIGRTYEQERFLFLGRITGYLDMLFTIAKKTNDVPLNEKITCWPVWSSAILDPWWMLCGHRGRLTQSNQPLSLNDLEAVDQAFLQASPSDVALVFSDGWQRSCGLKYQPNFKTNCVKCLKVIKGEELEKTKHFRYQGTYLPGSEYYGDFAMLICTECDKDPSWEHVIVPDFHLS